MRPEIAEMVEPGVDLLERSSVERIESARALGADRGETGLAQDFQMLRHGSLGDAELGSDGLDDLARGKLVAGQQFEDAAPNRVAEDIEGVHQSSIPLWSIDPRQARSSNRCYAGSGFSPV